MSNENNSEGRHGFLDAALAAFHFLVEFCFEVTRKDMTFLRFENQIVFINVYHGRLSYEVGLELGLVETGEKYSLYELLRAIAPEEINKSIYQTTDPETLERYIYSIADVVQRKFQPLLNGDLVAFEDLRSSVAPARKELTLHAQFGATIVRADKAWEKKDYKLAESLYQQAQEALDKTRIRRLRYLRGRKKDNNK